MPKATAVDDASCLDLDALEREAFSDRFDPALIAHRLVVVGDSTKDAFTRLRCSVILKEMGGAEQAYHVMRDALSDVRRHSDSLYEYALICRATGRDDEADAELARLSKSKSLSPTMLRELVFRSYFDTGVTARLARRLRRGLRRLSRDRNGAEMSDCNALEAFAEERSSLMCDVAAFYGRRRMASPYTVREQLAQALAEGRPFAFVRLGDGEGALLAPQQMSTLFAEHRAHFLLRWFGQPENVGDSAVLATAAELRQRLCEVDILGIPERAWLLHERDHRNVRTFMCCIAVVLTALNGSDRQELCSTSSHIDLAYRRLFDDLIRAAEKVIVVTCHAELAERLATHLDVPTPIDTMLVPPAYSDLDETGYAIERSHFGEAFGQVLAAVAQRARAGTLVLVGAGFLGKFYCLAAKRAGAVGVDIGSVTDLWMGFRTRPNFDGLQSIVLPRAPDRAPISATA